MFCEKCGRELVPTARFCDDSGGLRKNTVQVNAQVFALTETDRIIY